MITFSSQSYHNTDSIFPFCFPKFNKSGFLFVHVGIILGDKMLFLVTNDKSGLDELKIYKRRVEKALESKKIASYWNESLYARTFNKSSNLSIHSSTTNPDSNLSVEELSVNSIPTSSRNDDVSNNGSQQDSVDDFMLRNGILGLPYKIFRNPNAPAGTKPSGIDKGNSEDHLNVRIYWVLLKSKKYNQHINFFGKRIISQLHRDQKTDPFKNKYVRHSFTAFKRALSFQSGKIVYFATLGLQVLRLDYWDLEVFVSFDAGASSESVIELTTPLVKHVKSNVDYYFVVNSPSF
ncbi:Vacuolar fusion protein MON1 [Smittium mucronatum]|uniref:Vacuolar fusion protein MON1 n=1 Tax=Smittium mucronatum TaxID=133383 RepID=A0A1R0GV16_9FUNG|nr:Vacuolar fusion protein MON1 [Smittium mucronatum]